MTTRSYTFILLPFVLCLQSNCIFNKFSNHEKNEELNKDANIVLKAKSYPREDVLQYPAVRSYLEKHKVYVSLTTSPKRITNIPYVLETVDLSYVEKVILAIPKVFGRTQTPYTIPAEVTKFSKIHLITIEKDLGPITKLIPAIEHAKSLNDNDAIVITVDDDTAYPHGMVGQIIKALVENPNTIVGSSTQPVTFWGLDQTLWPDRSDLKVLEGFGAIGYRVGDVDTARMREIIEKQQSEFNSSTCYISDDIVINYVLAQGGIKRKKIKNPYFNIDLIKQFKYGFQEDALHRGAGYHEETIEAKSINSNKYLRCYEFMTSQFK